MNLQIIQNKIYEIRGLRVMLDFDLAELYGVETKRLKESVRRNKERFPTDFMFVLNTESLGRKLRPQDGWNTPSSLAFTEQGVAMLASVLKVIPQLRLTSVLYELC